MFAYELVTCPLVSGTGSCIKSASSANGAWWGQICLAFKLKSGNDIAGCPFSIPFHPNQHPKYFRQDVKLNGYQCGQKICHCLLRHVDTSLLFNEVVSNFVAKCRIQSSLTRTSVSKITSTNGTDPITQQTNYSMLVEVGNLPNCHAVLHSGNL